MIGDPATAPPRGDLPFLRRRSLPRPAPTIPPAAPLAMPPAAPPAAATRTAPPAAATRTAPPPAPGAAGAGGRISFDRPGRAPATPPSPTPAPPSPTPAPPAAAASPAAPPRPAGGVISFDRPGRTPAPPRAAPRPPTPPPAATPPPASGSLDLSTPAGGSLDLSAPAGGSDAASAARAPAPRRFDDRRVRSGEQRLLDIKTPTVTLSRVQSGVGQLSIEAVCSAEVGDLRLGAAYQLRGGGSSTVQYTGGNRFAPSTRRPILVAGRDEYEHLRLDLRQVTDLERLGVYAFSESRTELTWGGTLVVTTFGGARIELPLETLFAGTVAMLLSLYNLDGELVVRAEMETINGDVREVARAYGYDRITWRDSRSPVD